MSKPVVAIVGRPNVGKSTLFNVLAGDKISIVKDTPETEFMQMYHGWIMILLLLTQVVLNRIAAM